MTLTKAEIAHAVVDEGWQAFRLRMKGLPTAKKLRSLDDWLCMNPGSRMAEVQVENYRNALKRGGQLDLDGNVQR